MGNSKLHYPSGIPCIRFFHDLLPVCLDVIEADKKRFPDKLSTIAFCLQLYDFYLSPAQTVLWFMDVGMQIKKYVSKTLFSHYLILAKLLMA